MAIPRVRIRKIDGNTGVVRPSATGVLAMIAPAVAGPYNKPATVTRSEDAIARHGHGTLAEWAAYEMPTAQRPAMLVRPQTATAASYGAISVEGAPVADAAGFAAGGTAPNDDYDVEIEFMTAGEVGTTGITYRRSLDDGVTKSEVLALGTATSIVIPDSGVTLNLIDGGEDELLVAAGQVVRFSTKAAQMNSTNLADALTALRNTQSPFESVLVHGDATAATVAQLDLWLKGMNELGIYPTALVNVRRMNPGESEDDYKDAVALIVAAAASTDVVVCGSGGDLPSPIRGLSLYRPASLGIAARGMAIPLGENPAYVALGPVPGFSIVDDENNPKHHNEALFEGLDALRVATFRTFPRRAGVFITRARLISPVGSDYFVWPHARTMNEQCRIAHELLTTQLSRGVQKSPEPGPNGERYILEEEAAFIEGLVNAALERELVKPGHVVEAVFTLSRTDDLSSNEPAKLTGFNEQVAKAYVDEFDVVSRFARTITATAA